MKRCFINDHSYYADDDDTMLLTNGYAAVHSSSINSGLIIFQTEII